MNIPALNTTTGNPQVDDILRGTIGLLASFLPNRVRACYLHGSFADNTAIETSDIDLFVVARGNFTIEERAVVQCVMDNCTLMSPFMVEMMALDETVLLQHGHFRVKSASKFLWGEDIRFQIPEQTLAQYLHLYAHFPFTYMTSMLRGNERSVYPLSYPQQDGEFYGYDQLLLPPKNEPRHNIKKFVTGICWAATVLIAWQTGQTVSGKRASIQQYREGVHDEWTPFISEVYEWGNQRWRYLVPEQPEEHQHLRGLCAQALAFENHFLRQYRAYLLNEVQQDGERKRTAERQLGKCHYPDSPAG